MWDILLLLAFNSQQKLTVIVYNTPQSFHLKEIYKIMSWNVIHSFHIHKKHKNKIIHGIRILFILNFSLNKQCELFLFIHNTNNEWYAVKSMTRVTIIQCNANIKQNNTFCIWNSDWMMIKLINNAIMQKQFWNIDFITEKKWFYLLTKYSLYDCYTALFPHWKEKKSFTFSYFSFQTREKGEILNSSSSLLPLTQLLILICIFFNETFLNHYINKKNCRLKCMFCTWA